MNWRPRHPTPVTVTDAHAGELLRLVLHGLEVEARRSGARPSRAMAVLLADLYAAELRHATGQPQPGSDIGTGDAAPPTLDPDLLGTGDAAARLGCTTRRVAALCSSGRIAARRVGRAWLIEPQALDLYRFRTTLEDRP